jgi:predicted nucleic acid-binding protein
VSVAHLDAEVFSALARLERARCWTRTQVQARLELLGDLPVRRMPINRALLDAAWQLRATIAARDALYVAAAHALDATLVTTDARLRRAVEKLGRG